MTSRLKAPAVGGSGGIYGTPKRDMLGYGSGTPDPKWPGGVSELGFTDDLPVLAAVEIKSGRDGNDRGQRATAVLVLGAYWLWLQEPLQLFVLWKHMEQQ